MKNILKAIIGLLLVFLYHIPRLMYLGLLVSYAYVFNNYDNLTANPKEHIKRARKLLTKRGNSGLLYAALELRFAVERMIKSQLLFKDKVSTGTWKKRDPVIHAKALRADDERVDFPCEIVFLAKRTGERIPVGRYKPFPLDKVKEIDGRLGDLLHPKDGLSLGIYNDQWYITTRNQLIDTAEYLKPIAEDNVNIYAYADDNNYELVRD